MKAIFNIFITFTDNYWSWYLDNYILNCNKKKLDFQIPNLNIFFILLKNYNLIGLGPCTAWPTSQSVFVSAGADGKQKEL